MVDEAKLSDLIETAVDKSFKKNRTDFYIDPEIHYNDHQQIGEFFSKLTKMGENIRKTLVAGIILALLGMISTGFFGYLTHYLKEAK